MRHPSTAGDNVTLKFMNPELTTMQQLVLNNSQKHSERDFIGTRTKPDGTLDTKFTWMTYGQVFEKAKILGGAIKELGFAPPISDFESYSLNLVSVWSKNTPEYFIFDCACSLFGFTSVPIYDTLGQEAIEFMMKQTNLTTCFLSTPQIAGIVKLVENNQKHNLKNLVIMDDSALTSAQTKSLDELASHGMSYRKFSDLLIGYDHFKTTKIKLDTTIDDIYVISYTSGTTGEPKGAMISHKNIIAVSQMDRTNKLLDQDAVTTHISYLPLPHIFERICLALIMYRQGRIGVFSGDVTKIKEDAAILKPTIFATVPRLLNKIYDAMNLGFSQLTG